MRSSIFRLVARGLREHRRLLLIAALYGGLTSLVLPPLGEFPNIDDWDYAAAARQLAASGRLQFTDYPAMTLVSHVAWGAAFIRICGDSWLTLRVSTMVMAWIGGLSLYAVSRRLGGSPRLAAFATASYVLCPLVFALSYTFMTDITGASLMLLFLSLLPDGGAPHNPWKLAGLSVLGAACYLARQPAAIPFLLYTALVCGQCVWDGRRWREATVLILPALLLVTLFFLWLNLINGAPAAFGKIDLDFALLLQPKGLVSKFLGILLETALLLIPLAVLLAFRTPWRTLFRTRLRQALFLAAGLLWLALCVGFRQELRPFRNDTVTEAGLGVLFSVPGWHEQFSAASTRFGISSFHAAVLAVSACALPVFLIFLALQSHRLWGQVVSLRSKSNDPLPGIVLGSLTAHLLLSVLIEYLFDRYLVSVIGLSLALFLPIASKSVARDWGLPWVAMAGMIAVSLLGVQDSLSISRSYAAAIDHLKREGVQPQQFDELWPPYRRMWFYTPRYRYAGVQPRYLDHVLGDDSLNHRAADQPRYAVTFRPLPGWTIVRTTPSQSWIREWDVYTLRRQSE